ncbi:arginine--tRNA ligase, partial [Candidatus Saccharibacteria bacterium]|nr:arginine--tRNA ligase [Candidatus Saccharibacteria bacterium]NIV03675.1 arginine--tRNA ligase [Calditrichia bacterium]NIS38203.1 arginine--tRNA ligase [Candidatus Saccharibacteria bacterium]NIV71972.1 arginine--tRNA ligase [Calditrichia bacterium]NIV98762.1 arginine--tRNA ligase [Candidatus Saccharibacteria bacterium]
KIEAAGPYINFFVKPNAIAKITLENISKQKNKFGQSGVGEKKKILLEFSQPNTHKEFHIGHTRNALLGQSLVNILQASGYKVIPANYIGDTGAHVSKWLWAYEKFHQGEEPREDRAKFLSQVYQEAVEKISADENLKEEVSQIHQKLEKGDKELNQIWKKSRDWSIGEFKKIYKILNVDFDVYFYESEEEGPGKKMVADLLEKGIAKESQGAIIIDLEKYNLGVLLLLRSDGTVLYATKDIPLAFKKFEKFKIDESWYLVDSRQSFYFQQLFKTLEIIGLKKPLKHLVYEFVATPEGVISSRAGEVPSFTNTYEFVSDLAEQSTKQRHPDWSVKKINQTAKIIALAAIKFEMLKSSREREIVFDPKKALSFEGFTGPYLLYTVARINSILKKEKPGKIKDWNTIKIAPLEKQLVIKMLSFPEIVAEAARSAQPSIIAQ